MSLCVYFIDKVQCQIGRMNIGNGLNVDVK